MSGICDMCRREPCHMRFDDCKTCDVYECGESNYEKLFGTPERAARTLEKGKTLCAWCDKQTCSTSGGECRIYDYDALLDWLLGLLDDEEVHDEL